MPFGGARGVCIRNKDIHIEMSLSNRYLIYRQIIYKFRKGVFDKFILVFFGAPDVCVFLLFFRSFLFPCTLDFGFRYFG